MEHVTFFLGLIATIGTVAFGIPQAVKSTRERSNAGVSLATWWMALVICWPWGAYGVEKADPFLIVTNVLAAVVAIWVLVACSPGRAWKTLIVASGITVVAFLALSAAPTVALIASATIVMVLSRVPQLMAVIRARDVGAVSLTTWWLSLATATTWALYGVLRGDAVVYLANGVAAFTTAILVARLLFLQYSKGSGSPTAASDDAEATGKGHEKPKSENT